MFIRREELCIRGGDATGTCDACGATVLVADLTWEDTSWVNPKLDRGHHTAWLCPECVQYGWNHCWKCGRLTAADRDTCHDCEENP